VPPTTRCLDQVNAVPMREWLAKLELALRDRPSINRDRRCSLKRATSAPLSPRGSTRINSQVGRPCSGSCPRAGGPAERLGVCFWP